MNVYLYAALTVWALFNNGLFFSEAIGLPAYGNFYSAMYIHVDCVIGIRLSLPLIGTARSGILWIECFCNQRHGNGFALLVSRSDRQTLCLCFVTVATRQCFGNQCTLTPFCTSLDVWQYVIAVRELNRRPEDRSADLKRVAFRKDMCTDHWLL
jgi:hypothetical protein